MLRPSSAHLPIETDEAALYLGHLAAQVEIATPGKSRECQLALTWLASIVAARGQRYWNLDIDGLKGPDRISQNWRISGRLQAGPADPIDLARWRWLQADGRELANVAFSALGIAPGGDASDDQAVERRLAEMSAIVAIKEMPDERWSACMKDACGTLILIDAHQKLSFARLRKRFLSL